MDVVTVPVSSIRKSKTAPKGRQIDPLARDEIEALLADSPREKQYLIEYLHCIQDAFGHISADHIAALAEAFKLSQVEVFEVATFYHHFDVVKEGQTPPPKHTVRVCDGLSCALAGAEDLLARLSEEKSAEVRVIRAPCVGQCDHAPMVVVNKRQVRNADVGRVLDAIASTASSFDEVHSKDSSASPNLATPSPQPSPPGGGSVQTFNTCGVKTAFSEDYLPKFPLFEACIAGGLSLDAVLAVLDEANLRGLGGAGFPAGRKWKIVRGFAGRRALVVNADEGEPGTFKDRHYLETNPWQFWEGVLIAAWAVEAQDVYVYLRDEYHDLRGEMTAQLGLIREYLQKNTPPPGGEGLGERVAAQAMSSAENVNASEQTNVEVRATTLSPNPSPPGGGGKYQPNIELRRGAGAYICGEESALIESIEGKRGIPRLRPPYIAESGVFGRPTLAHNVETLYWIPEILSKGSVWWNSHGRNGRVGLRSFSVSGRVKNPGVKLAPAGITARELIDEFCGGMLAGHSLYGYLPGGASGGILPATLANVPLDFDTLQPYGCFIGSAAVIVLSEHDTAKAAALNMMKFFEHESCGQCTPCRAGTAKAAQLMAQPKWDEALLKELSQTMVDASICGLGQAAPNPLLTAMKYFPHEFSGDKFEK